MGVIHIDATIRNPADRTKSWQGRFLVDTGATDSGFFWCFPASRRARPRPRPTHTLGAPPGQLGKGFRAC